MNPVFYFEIPVHDLTRAMAFYGQVFGYRFERISIDGNEMALFPYDDQMPGASGALAQGESYVPGTAGVRLYFRVAAIDSVLKDAVRAGGRVLYPPTRVDGFGTVAEFEDSEGNCIALHDAS